MGSKYVKIGSDYTHQVQFLVGGEFVIPDQNLATVTITNNAGTVVGDFNAKEFSIPEGTSGLSIPITSLDNQNTLQNEVRYVDVDFVYNGAKQTISDFYLLRDIVKFPLSPIDVLNVLGLGNDLSSDQVDILAAYDSVKVDADPTNLDNILTGGGPILPYLINAVKYKAAMSLSVGAQNSIMQMEQSDNTLYRRFMEIDFDTIDAKIASLYQEALYKLLGSQAREAVAISQMFQGVDPVTGE